MLCSVTVTSDSLKAFENFYMLLPYYVTLVILTTSELLPSCFTTPHTQKQFWTGLRASTALRKKSILRESGVT